MNEERTAYYLNNFFGYGNWNSDFWFVGMEEGGGDILQLVNNKIDSFYNNHYSQESLIDNYHFQINCVGRPCNEEAIKFLGPRPNNQPVRLQMYWSKKIRILLGINGLETTTNSIRLFQTEHWGRIHNLDYTYRHAVVELLPLPSPSRGEWQYLNWTEHFTGVYCPFLQTRQVYYNHIMASRVEMLISKINEYKPRLIILSGAQNDIEYNLIAEIINWENFNYDGFNCHFQTVNNTLFVKTMAPNTWGLTTNYWELVINEISNRL